MRLGYLAYYCGWLIIILITIIALLPSDTAVSNDSIATYLEYNGIWYEFRYDWRDYQKYPTNFQSVDELRAWLEHDSAPLALIANESGIVSFNGQCEDIAFQLRDRAYDAGKQLETEILTRQECYKYRQYLTGDISSLGMNDGHYLNKAVIGNEVWFVEPSNDNIWLAYYLD